MERDIKFVFFDAGNTLFKEEPLRWHIYANAGREAGLQIDPADMRRAMVEVHEELPQRIHGHFRYSDRWFEEYIPRVFQRFGAKPEQIPVVAEKLFAAFREPGTFRLFPETLEVLAKLQEMGIPMGIISNWSPRLPKLCRNLEIDRYFEFIFSSAIEEAEKPQKEIFERALKLVGAQPENALHVGDSLEKDVRGAAGAGILGVLLDREGFYDGERGFPVARNLLNIIDLVKGK